MIIGISGRMGAGKDTLGMVLQALTMPGVRRWKGDPIGYAEAYKGQPNLKGGWKIVKFADKLKEIASLILGVPREKFEDQVFKDSVLGPEYNTWRVYFTRNDEQYGQDFLSQQEAARWEANERLSLRWPRTVGTYIEEHKMTVREFLQKLGTEAMREGIHTNIWINALFADYKATGMQVAHTKSQTLPNWIVTDVRFPNEAQSIIDRGGVIVRIDRPNNPIPSGKHKSEHALDTWSFDMKVVNSDTDIEGLVHCAKRVLAKVKYEDTDSSGHSRETRDTE